MEESVLTAVLLPLALAFIMVGMGLSLQWGDFKRIALYPKAILIGLTSQLLLLPLLAFGLIQVFGLSGSLAVGVMILAACPGGATSNLICHLSKGDTALSISLTALSSLITVLSIPLIVNFALGYFLGEEGSLQLPWDRTVLQIFGITVVPVSLGMFLHQRFPRLAQKADRPVRIISAVFLALIIVAALIKERAQVLEFFQSAGPLTLSLNLLSLGLGLGLGRLFALSKKQSLSLAIETGIQNGTLGIVVAATFLQNSAMTIPSAIYSLIMFGTALLVIFWGNRWIAKDPNKVKLAN